jgi:NhaP-type Na+/H+ or K+/H+ antiporter
MSSWAIFISLCLLIAAFLVSYLLQQKRIEAVHETVISIFAGGFRSVGARRILYSLTYPTTSRNGCWLPPPGLAR